MLTRFKKKETEMMNKKHIRHTVLYVESESTHETWVVFTVFEQLEPDMQDYDISFDNYRENLDGYNIHLVHTFMDTDGAIDVKPIPIVFVDGKLKEINNHGQYTRLSDNEYIITTTNQETGLTKVLPWREGPMYIQGFKESDACTYKQIKENQNIVAAISRITSSQLGFDLWGREESIGAIYYVWHHEVVKNIRFRLSMLSDNIGVMCGIEYRKHQPQALKFVLQDVDKDGNIIQEGRCCVSEGESLFLIRFEKAVNALTVYVFDDSDKLVFCEKNMHFIRSIKVSTGVVDAKTGKVSDLEVSVIGAKDDKAGSVGLTERRKAKYVNEIKRILKDESLDVQKEIIETIKQGYEES